jgi:hypothetical protein
MNPTALEQVIDYLTGYTSEEDAAAFEEWLFTEPDLAGDAAFLDRFARLAEHLAARGTLATSWRRADAEAVLRSGRRVAYLDIGERRSVEYRLPDDCEQFLYRFGLDLEGVDRLDAELSFGGQVYKVFPEVDFDREEGSVYGFCEAPLARMAFGRGPAVVRFIAHSAGHERELARVDVHVVVD